MMDNTTPMKDKRQLIQWLHRPSTSASFSTITNREVLDHMFQIIYEWMNSYEEIQIIPPKEILLGHFYLFMFTDDYPVSPMPEEEFDYMSTKYTDEIVDTFLLVRDISDSYGSHFFHKKYDSADRLLQFITSHCMVIDDTDFIENEEEVPDEHY